MHRFEGAAIVRSALLTLAILWSGAFAQSSPVSLEESLTAQYRQGTVLVLQSNGILGVPAACQVIPGSIFKDGQLHAPGFVQKTVVAAAKCDLRSFAMGSKVYLSRLGVSVKGNRIDLFMLQCDVANCSSGVETSYKAQVAFEFPKKYLMTAQLGPVQDLIKQVVSIDTNTSTDAGQITQAGNEPAAPGIPIPPALASAYVSSQNKSDQLRLNPDSSFSLKEGGQSFSGAYSVTGATLKLNIVQLQKDVDIEIRGNQLIVNGDETWVPVPDGTGDRGSASVPAAQPDPQQNDPDTMAARMLSELPSAERIGQAVRVFLTEMKQKGALPQEAFAVPTPTVIPSNFDMGAGAAPPTVLDAMGIFEMRNGTYQCGSADSGLKAKSKKGSPIYTLSAKIHKQQGQQWVVTQIDAHANGCSPTWQVQIPVP